MLKVGVLGAGHLGKIHLRLLQQSDKYELVGFYDENHENNTRKTKNLYSLFTCIYSILLYSIFSRYIDYSITSMDKI